MRTKDEYDLSARSARRFGNFDLNFSLQLFLFHPQRHDRVDFGRAPRRQPTGE
jgi:hypothetical protein